MIGTELMKFELSGQVLADLTKPAAGALASRSDRAAVMGKEMFAALPPVLALVEIAGERIELTPLKAGEVPALLGRYNPSQRSFSIA